MDFYDKDVLANVTKESQKLSKVLSNTLNKMKVKTGDAFLVWRMREMAAAGTLQVMGDWNKGWKEITVMLPGGSAAAENTETEA